MSDFTHNLKHNFMTFEDWKALLINSFFIGFIVSFRDWGTDSFNLMVGLINLIISIIIVGIALFVHDTARRFYGYTIGYKTESFIWKTGMVLAFLFTVVSNGRIWFLAPGGFIVYHLERQRLGQFRYGVKPFDIGKIALVGPIASIFMGLFCRYLFNITGLWFFERAMFVSVALAICTMLPLPCIGPTPSFAGDVEGKRLWHVKGPTNGLALLIASRLLFVLVFSGVVAIGLLTIFMKSVIAAFFWGLLFAVVMQIIFFSRSESKFM